MNKYQYLYIQNINFVYRVVKQHTYDVTSRIKYEINVKKGSDITSNFFTQQVSQFQVPLWDKLPCEQRLHFCCLSWRAKSSLCWKPFKSVLKSGRINEKNGLFPLLDWFRALRESCVADQSCPIFLYPQNSRHLTTDLTINFPYKSCDEFCACTIENWTVVGRGYFSHASSNSENVASARRVETSWKRS